MTIQAPKGTRDIYGDEMRSWQLIEDKIRNLTRLYGFSEIRNPVFEHTELFLRGVGDTTDIVQKEMYTFNDKADRSITLRPELTAGVARAFIEHGMGSQPQPTKLYYIGPIFRYEKPQAGRYRQHYQFGVELFGAYTPAAEAEVISLGYTLIDSLGLKNINLHLNSIGCPDCRKIYHEKLKEYLQQRLSMLCETCQDRFTKNPLRIIDCKNPGCQKELTDAPMVLSALDDECRKHFSDLQELLNSMRIPYMIDPKVVRGLDYYTRTVFEFIGDGLTVIGGGRYDGLIACVGGAPTGGVGFGMGLDRLALEMKNTLEPEVPTLFIGSADGEGFNKAQVLAYEMRKAGVSAQCDLPGRSVKAQMKYANKIGAKYTMIIGCSELAEGSIAIKNMETGEETRVKLEAQVICEQFLQNN